MAKFYKKSQLTFESGYVVNTDGDVVALPPCVADQLNEIETIIQKAIWLSEQPEECKGPDLSEFERESCFDKVPEIVVETPLLDEKVKQSKAIEQEVHAACCASELNKLIAGFKEAFAFVSEDSFVEGDRVVRLDLLTLGDPLKLTADGLAHAMGSTVFDSEPDEE